MTIQDIGQQIADLRVDMIRANPPQVMNPEEAATFLGVTTETLFRWRKDGNGPKFSQPTSRVVRYLRSDLIEFLREYQ
ncbi:helix-turn-helix transcriptional regulator [Ruegeria arenilitoris]|uniref:helix-turn-helix transcriptional regulator n=1 Tax=Ruegeria arenilitoris TaxID=1173585 RepID=UPI001C2C5542|nr:helix-turn-helix domain-containing protein [Ruegeria arenilitoris]